MRILQLPRRFVREDWGGTETVVLETSKSLLQMGHHTEIFCPQILSDELRGVMDGVAIQRFPYFYPYLGMSEEAKHLLDKKGGNVFSYALMKALHRYPKLDILHLHTGKRTGGIGRYIAKKRGIPYVISLHGGAFDVPAEEAASWTAPTEKNFEWGKALGLWVGSRRVLQDAYAIICVGKEEQQKVQEKFPKSRVLYLPNGVHPHRFATGDGAAFRQHYRIADDKKVMLVLGRIAPQKNQVFAVGLLDKLVRGGDDVHLVIIGHVNDQGYYQKLKTEIAERQLDKNVTVISGLTPDHPHLVQSFHASDLFLLPSIHEPFGIVILEAWSAGLPVVASRVGGIPGFTSEADVTLCPVNEEEAFVKAIREVFNNKNFANNLAQNGQKKARQEYSWEAITQQLVKIYEDALGSARK